MSEDSLADALSTVREIVDVQSRAAAARSRSDRFSAVILGLGYAAVAAGCALRSDVPSLRDVILLLSLVGLYIVAHRTEFVAAGGEVAVLSIFSTGPPHLGAWPVYVLALSAQFAADAAAAVVRCTGLGLSPSRLIAPLRWTFTVDALLAPLGVCVVVAARGSPVGVALLAVPIVLVRVLGRDRSEQLAQAVALGTAFTAVREQAMVDPLTGLGNRRAWLEAPNTAVRRREADQRLVAVILVADVDGLKRVNDLHGHDAGDALLRSVAATLDDVAPPGAVVARLGGDEFGILSLVRDEADSASLPAAVRERLRRQPPVFGTPPSVSVGVAACPPAPNVYEATRRADLAAAGDKITRRAGRA